MFKILVTGGNGLLAHALHELRSADCQLNFLSRSDFDLTAPARMEQQLDKTAPDVVINTAAYNLVDHCEIERELSWAVNATGPQQLAELCAHADIRLVHYGTDYVFDGEKKSPYLETDAPNPLNHYAAGKLAGEQAVLSASPIHLVLRTSWIFGGHPTQTKTFVHTVLRAARAGRELKATTDQVSVPTYAPDLAQWTLELVRRGANGLVHAVNDEGASRHDWTLAILEEAVQAGLIPQAPPVEKVTTAFFNSTMRRPAYTAMNNEKLAELLGRQPGSWRPGLRKMLAQMK
ncbi:MAG TPA: dTDP-4-dehydrorhamnose reductase [Candidatus Sulfopaludibacter sp.]|nr:dTDP-4-dehydrorhamnose reductase [Candidatus Sulfopaludibacter sp.]